jgi:DNA-directed RNA polymerase subunit RPC12/RpoP
MIFKHAQCQKEFVTEIEIHKRYKLPFVFCPHCGVTILLRQQIYRDVQKSRCEQVVAETICTIR